MISNKIYRLERPELTFLVAGIFYWTRLQDFSRGRKPVTAWWLMRPLFASDFHHSDSNLLLLKKKGPIYY